MTGREIDPQLLGRLAERLEETGRTVKAFSAQNAQLSAQVFSLKTSVDNLNARLKSIEHTVNGNGGKGLKTELELLKREVQLAEDGMKTFQKWREGLGTSRVIELQQAQKDGKANIRNTILTLVAISIALGSMFASCGPQWFKAWKPTDKEASSAEH